MALGRTTISTLGFLVALAVSIEARAVTDEERAGARAAAGAGFKACEAKDYALCIERFSKAEAIVHSPVHLMYLGRAHLALGHLVEAREAYLKISREGAPSGAPLAVVAAVEEANQKLPELEGRIPDATVNVQGADGKEFSLLVDGKPVSAALVGIARPINPGTHEFSVTAPGMKSEPVTITVAEGDHKELTLVLVPESSTPSATPATAAPTSGSSSSSAPSGPASPSSEAGPNQALLWSGIGALGVGVAGVALGVVFGMDAKDKAAEADRLCGGSRAECELDRGTPTANQVEQLNRQSGDAFALQIVGFGVGGAGLLGGAALVFFSLPSNERPSTSTGFTWTPVLGPKFAGVRGTF